MFGHVCQIISRWVSCQLSPRTLFRKGECSAERAWTDRNGSLVSAIVTLCVCPCVTVSVPVNGGRRLFRPLWIHHAAPGNLSIFLHLVARTILHLVIPSDPFAENIDGG
ncbi:uncharacterized protein B0I36DRAFT_313463 [Microdochium trichocladiopsis]|uniref:Uncharacterized protein n=1 Tax=Microdochium trichocladiopsis TaxID=1682393 RepID=A0A9P8YAP7_9PEZI|nr:uncharacterized protein B0I36DRAFT_313463 [Microdochium trichocladiopsis]KAH7037171.1 hypothetical protein B0I36DRAFT_313463 [Microdochium trichocladiopsis]